ncbi:MAG: DUF2155 domain-containing protein [Pseudomonadota bacterium]
MLKLFCNILICILLYTTPSFAEDLESVFDITEDTDGETTASEDSVFAKMNENNKSGQVPASSEGYYNGAKIIALNKITANSKTITLRQGEVAYFNNAKIELHKCWTSGKLITPISKMLITITENKFDEDPKVIFKGWIIANQAALSTFEHPVYELLAVGCVGQKLN